ncbi:MULTISPECIES: S-layer homology domain-containing protein [Cyanophyceae]|uniref:S-layer homology domain-containing protein n=1 Tax=Cyanophyceae TaxID=3028117 RepID=UPI00168904FC|nr:MULTISPECIES: S-layer homology domain-containing protein [Cyanophyceae]MBD1914549.1 S-layer homology domain-containing protein [Phormidium sp. FACHB-77]MBD2033048.1 S-layer homology domain-containing protein [Phormidium sp. FACHB-322]MBD2049819.1 S-layer homology domain-containing protein [Leptolyngbya sp. FACHB-60]
MDTITKTLDVDPNRGIDEPSGRPHLPYKTLTIALGAAQSNTLIKLAPGTYSAATGERFPITLPDGVMIAGQESNQGQGIAIAGGGPGPGATSVGLILQGQSQLRGVTVQNPQGIGILIDADAPLVRACRLSQCKVGLQVAGASRPLVAKTGVTDCGDRGLSFVDQARGEVQDCTVERCGTGIYLGQNAAPLIRGCQCSNSQVGVQIAGAASPVLRQNRLVQNQTAGLVVQDTGRPDLGQPDDPAGNILRYNRQSDLRNDTQPGLTLVGNDVIPTGLVGTVNLVASQWPDPAAVPPVLLDRPTVSPAPPAPTPPTPSDKSPAPVVPVPSRFADLGSHWATPYIEALADRGLVKGYGNGTYRPQETINRGQFAALVAASYSNFDPVRGAVTFVDVPPTHWAANAIDQAQRKGFLGGYPDQTFRPNQGMVRVQAIVAVATGLKLLPAPASGLGVYRDRAQIPSYAIDALASATRAGLVINHPDPELLRPLETMTRAEVAVLIYQGLVAQSKAPPLTTVAIPPAAMAQGSFPDIQTHWALDFIQGLLNLGLVQGDQAGRFNPAQPMSRAQFAALMSRAFAPAPRRPAQLFRDVPSGHWAAGAIQTAYRGGFLSGFPDQTFGPENSLLRAQVWVSLISGLALLPNQPGNLRLLERYRDRATIPDYAVNAIAKATQLGLVVNVPDIAQLNPNRVASRADVCAAVYQALVLQLRASRIDNPFIVRA